MVTREQSLLFGSDSETWAVLISSVNQQFNELFIQAVPYTPLSQDNKLR